MKAFLFLILALPNFVLATQIEIIGPCKSKPLYKFNATINGKDLSVGKVTIDSFKEFDIDYVGNEDSILTIESIPTLEQSFEIVNENHIRAYGWCYQVDGFEPDVIPSEYPLSEGKLITWFIGFAEKINGVWITQCIPANTISPDHLCSNTYSK